MSEIWAVLMGVGLAAACGLRVFLPIFAAGVAARLGFIELGGLPFLATDQALIVSGVATVVEIGAYYIPWLDNLLDTIATPAAVIAGTLLSAAFIVDLDPLWKWTFAAIAGGGVAGAVQLTTVGMRATSTFATGGLLNPVVSTLEAIGSVILTMLALLGFAAFALAIAVIPPLVAFAIWRLQRKPSGSTASDATASR